MTKVSLERRAEIGRERRRRTRSRILQVAFELLGHRFGRSTRIDQICDAAGVARGTFYNHFDSVETLFDALGYEISHAYNDAVRVVIRAQPAGAIRSAFALRYYLHRTRDDPAWGWAMVNLSAGGPIFGQETFRYATESIEEGIAAGQFRVPTAEIGRDIMVGATLAGMFTILHSTQPPGFAEALVAQILFGLGVEENLIQASVNPPLPDPFQAGAQDGQVQLP